MFVISVHSFSIYIYIFLCNTHSHSVYLFLFPLPFLVYFLTTTLALLRFSIFATLTIYIHSICEAIKDRYVYIRSCMCRFDECVYGSKRAGKRAIFFSRARATYHVYMCVCVWVYGIMNSNFGNFVILFSLNCFHNKFSPKKKHLQTILPRCYCCRFLNLASKHPYCFQTHKTLSIHLDVYVCVSHTHIHTKIKYTRLLGLWIINEMKATQQMSAKIKPIEPKKKN